MRRSHLPRVKPIYEHIGAAYRRVRREDPRLARVILDALGDGDSVANVGAGTGSYEPRDRLVVAVEPSITMLRERPQAGAFAVRAAAGALPLRDGSVSASLAVLTVHHWANQDAGLAELCRVARERVVIVTWDPESTGFWLTADYFPEFVATDRGRFPTLASLSAHLQDAKVIALPIPHDCQDGFLGAYWRRPGAYLDASVRGGISSFARCRDLSPLRRLERDLEAGTWEARYGATLPAEELDLGYRVVVGRPRRARPSGSPSTGV